MNSDKAPTPDIKITFGKKLRCQRSAGFFCYVIVASSPELASSLCALLSAFFLALSFTICSIDLTFSGDIF
jgi:hypothetical protein